MSFEPRLTEGAAETAPTAPHATLRGEGEATGPERFWLEHRKNLIVTMVLSLFLHWTVSPWSFLPTGEQIEIKDQEGDLLIPADLFDDPGPLAPAPQPAPDNPPASDQGAGLGLVRDASTPSKDAAVVPDGGRDAGADGLSPSEAGAAFADDGGIAYVDDDDGGLEGGRFGRDPMETKTGAGPNNVMVAINFQVIRSHPLGPRLQPILTAIPEWKTFMSGSSIDPYRDTDWMVITGPSLVDTTKDAIYIHYSASDAEVEKAVVAVSAQYAKGGPMDVGAPGVKAWRAYAHGAERALLMARGQHIVLIVPSTHAKPFAQDLAKGPPTPRLKKGEAVRTRFARPGGSVSLIPPSISELRLWVAPRNADGGGDLYAEGDCPDPAAATQAAADLERAVQSKNSLGVKLLTAGLLSGFEAHAEGRTVKVHLPASKDQIEAIFGLVGGQLGVPPPKP